MIPVVPAVVLLAFQGPAHFDVASIKPTPANLFEIHWSPEPGGLFLAEGITVRDLIALAYGLQDYQIQGAPKWISTDRFTISAKVEHCPGRFNRQQLLPLIQNLLTSRFSLVTAAHMKEMQVFALIPAKSGVRLTPATETSPTIDVGRGRLAGKSVSMDLLARSLSTVLNCPVLNKTGISGNFIVQLSWSPDDSPEAPSIFTALQEELGLRLQSTRAPAEILEVLSVGRPTEN